MELCESRNLDAAVARVPREALAELAEYLSGLRPTGGIPAQIFGMVSARLGEEDTRRKTSRRKTQD
jgi:hypothetical protein